MKGNIDYKVPDGKLLRIDAEIEGNIIRSVRITGDFFIYPEEAISDIEAALCGSALEANQLTRKLMKVVSSKAIRFLGISTSDIVNSLMKLSEAQ